MAVLLKRRGVRVRVQCAEPIIKQPTGVGSELLSDQLTGLPTTPVCVWRRMCLLF